MRNKCIVDKLLDCFLFRTVFIGLDDGLVALLPSLWVGQDHLETNIGVWWQVSYQVAWC